MTEQQEIYDIPNNSSAGRFASRKTLYEAGEVNIFPLLNEDGEVEGEGYMTFDAARLIAVSAREQTAKRQIGDKEVPYTALVAELAIILDDPEIGVIDDNGEQVPHPLHRETRFTKWQNLDRPYRVNGQQWVQPGNTKLLWSLLEELQDSHEFAVRIDPPNPENSQRTTQDKVRARPIANRTEMDIPSDYGAHLDAFEVSVNPNYEPGFKSFVHGLNEQMERIEDAFDPEITDKERAKLRASLEQNVHFLGGVRYDKGQRRWWARPVDVGLVVVNGTSFPLYEQRGPELTEDLFTKTFGHLANQDLVSVSASGEKAAKAAVAGDDEVYDF